MDPKEKNVEMIDVQDNVGTRDACTELLKTTQHWRECVPGALLCSIRLH